jgi:predicted amidohydrolase YtcJ
MRLAGLTRDTPDPVGGYFEHDEQGELTGKLVENAMSAVNDLQADPGPDEYDRMLRAVTDRLLELGITSSTEANLEDPQAFAAYQRMCADPSARRVRYNVMFGHWQMLDPGLSLGLETGFGNRWLRCGAMKFFVDGTEGMRTAKLSESFSDEAGNSGMWMFPPEEFRERVLRAHLGGWQCATHAIGDAAVELALDVYREAQEQLPRPDIRHRIEHASLLRPDLVERFAREGVVPVPGGRFASNDYQVLIERFGPERMRWYQPWNALMERNVPVAVSSDAPVQTPDPGKNLRAIVTSHAEHNPSLTMQPEERIDLGEALLAYTRNGAWASHEERVKGMLRTGMVGDVTVFNSDIFALDPDSLDTIEAALTIVDGVIAHRTS